MKCTFCGNEVMKGTGIMFVKKDGTIYNFDKGKCEKNFIKLKRKPANTKWTELYNRNKSQTKRSAEKKEKQIEPEKEEHKEHKAKHEEHAAKHKEHKEKEHKKEAKK